VLDLLVDNEFPGSVLVRMGLGNLDSYNSNKAKWNDDIQGLLKRESYELRVHLFQVPRPYRCCCCCGRSSVLLPGAFFVAVWVVLLLSWQFHSSVRAVSSASCGLVGVGAFPPMPKSQSLSWAKLGRELTGMVARESMV